MIRMSPRWADVRPHPDLGPDDVVRIQLAALADNSEQFGDSGIAACYEFASPENRSQVGPFDRFVRLLNSPAYRPLLTQQTVRVGPLRIAATIAVQVISVRESNQREQLYLWRLSRQHRGKYDGCWMTDAVLLINRDEVPEQLLPTV